MSGIRLHHSVFANCTYVVELETPYKASYDCPECGKPHQRKSIHLRLDANGDVIVAPDVYDKLRAVFLAGLELANEVESPPPLELGAVDVATHQIIEQPLNNGTKTPDFYVPGKTRYESRDHMLQPFQPYIDAALEKQDRKATKKRSEKRSIHDLSPKPKQN